MDIGMLVVENLPAILCLFVGFVLVVVEMYIPGFGAPGIIGMILLIAGVALRARSPLEALIMSVVIIALLCIALSISIRSIAKGRLSNSRFILKKVAQDEVIANPLDERDLDYFVGSIGTTKTVLRPSGIGEFDGVRLNVVSDGEFIPKDMPVRVERVEGNRIIVSTQIG